MPITFSQPSQNLGNVENRFSFPVTVNVPFAGMCDYKIMLKNRTFDPSFVYVFDGKIIEEGVVSDGGVIDLGPDEITWSQLAYGTWMVFLDIIPPPGFEGLVEDNGMAIAFTKIGDSLSLSMSSPLPADDMPTEIQIDMSRRMPTINEPRFRARPDRSPLMTVGGISYFRGLMGEPPLTTYDSNTGVWNWYWNGNIGNARLFAVGDLACACNMMFMGIRPFGILREMPGDGVDGVERGFLTPSLPTGAAFIDYRTGIWDSLNNQYLVYPHSEQGMQTVNTRPITSPDGLTWSWADPSVDPQVAFILQSGVEDSLGESFRWVVHTDMMNTFRQLLISENGGQDWNPVYTLEAGQHIIHHNGWGGILALGGSPQMELIQPDGTLIPWHLPDSVIPHPSNSNPFTSDNYVYWLSQDNHLIRMDWGGTAEIIDIGDFDSWGSWFSSHPGTAITDDVLMIGPTTINLAPTDFTVQVTNNGNDIEPTWEDCTQEVLNRRIYNFQNTTNTSGEWGVNFKITVNRNNQMGPIQIANPGGGFE